MRARFIPLDGGDPIEIDKDITLIGRRRMCDVQLDHQSISKVHLVVVKTDGVLFFRDLASTNGTKVNGQRVCRGALLPNDQLSVAACKFRVELSSRGEEESDSGKTDVVSQELPVQSPVRRVIQPGANRSPGSEQPKQTDRGHSNGDGRSLRRGGERDRAEEDSGQPRCEDESGESPLRVDL